MREVLILGGYGNFGKRIARALVRSKIPVIVAGRNGVKANALATELGTLARAEVMEVEQELAAVLMRVRPAVVINTCGPFQFKDYRVAETCIAQGVHYVDLADGREFVTGITTLDARAKAAGVWVMSGASTVPGLSSAVLEHYKAEFRTIDSLIYGISPGQKAERGLATTQGILSYVGKRLRPVPGDVVPRYGWQDMYRQPYPVLGTRWMANCDVPDLDLFPTRYGIRRIRFSAGMEHTLLHGGIWLLGWLVRLGMTLRLENHAAFLLRASHWFDGLGTANGGMHMILRGEDMQGKPVEQRWFIVAREGDGPQIPCVPAILLARALVAKTLPGSGAQPCVGMVTLQEYVAELAQFAVEVFEEKAGVSEATFESRAV